MYRKTPIKNVTDSKVPHSQLKRPDCNRDYLFI